MSFDTQQQPYKDLRSVIAGRSGKIICWTGSGLSTAANLPTWPQLKQQLLSQLREKASTTAEPYSASLMSAARQAENETNPWVAFQILKQHLGRSTYRNTIRESIRPALTANCPPVYRYIWQIGAIGILNLNLDRLATKAWNTVTNKKGLTEFSGRDAGGLVHILKSPRPFIANLHGIADDEKSWVLTKRELDELLNNEGYRMFVQSCLATTTILFLGVSANDRAVGGHLEALTKAGIDTGSHYWLTRRSDMETDTWAEQAGIQIIRYEQHSDVVGFFEDIIQHLPNEGTPPPPVRFEGDLESQEPPLPDKDYLLQQNSEYIRNRPFPRKVYARLEAIEVPDADQEQAHDTLIAFDAVSAEWIDSRHEPFFAFDEGFEERVTNYWEGMFERRGSEIRDDPYESAPVFHIELSLPSFDPWIEPLQELDDQWVEFDLGEFGKHQVDVFRDLFDPEPEVAWISDAPKPVSGHLPTQLSTAFDMCCWPDASASALGGLFSSFPPIEQLIAFDVGQGSATCLVPECPCPSAGDARDPEGQSSGSCDDPSSSEADCRCGLPLCYFDLGCGVYRNAPTRPKNLQFCNSNDPPVILSHWDADHWAGAQKDRRFLQSSWVAPRQSIGPSHTKFANKILRSGGSLLIVDGSMVPVTWNGRREDVTLLRAGGRGRNDSGLIMQIRNRCEDKDWLLTGDADYKYIPNLPTYAAAITVPHHGASKCGVPPPIPSSQCASRLLYSFGPGNKHGRNGVSHPRSAAVAAHVSVGWSSPSWGTPPGYAVAGGTTLATAKHPGTHLGWAAAGWDRMPPPPHHLMHCLGTANPPQT